MSTNGRMDRLDEGFRVDFSVEDQRRLLTEAARGARATLGKRGAVCHHAAFHMAEAFSQRELCTAVNHASAGGCRLCGWAGGNCRLMTDVLRWRARAAFLDDGCS